MVIEKNQVSRIIDGELWTEGIPSLQSSCSGPEQGIGSKGLKTDKLVCNQYHACIGGARVSHGRDGQNSLIEDGVSTAESFKQRHLNNLMVANLVGEKGRFKLRGPMKGAEVAILQRNDKRVPFALLIAPFVAG